MARHYSMDIQSVVVPHPEGKGSYCTILFNHAPADIAAVYAAGEVAEELVLGKASFAGSFDDVGRIWELSQALQIADHPAWRAKAFRRANLILKDLTDQLQAIAQALKERTTLSREEIADLLESK